MRYCLCAVIACLALASCTEQSTDLASERQGIAELRVDAASLAAANVTRVVVQRGEETQELVFNVATRSYDGAMFLASGPQTLVGRAFAGDVLVGASNPVTVNVTPGRVNRVILRILDLTPNTPAFGPVFDSLTFPTSVSAGTTATFAMSVISPTHDPVTYQWSSDCADSTFSAPDAAQTSWSKPSQGSCQIDVVATSNGYSIAQRFIVVVFSGDDGAATVNGVFVEAPDILLQLETFNSPIHQYCGSLSSVYSNGSCSVIASAPDGIIFHATVLRWGSNSAPGDVILSDDCGGGFAFSSIFNDVVGGLWMPPAAGGLCFVTARAVNSDGLSASAPVAILTRPGTLPVTRPPRVHARLGTCEFEAPQDIPQDCGGVASNSRLDFDALPEFLGSRGGILTVTDDCGGGQFQNISDVFDVRRTWTSSATPGANCHLTLTATNLEGVTTTASALYRLF